VGLLVTVMGLEEWSGKYDDEYTGSELTDGCLEFEDCLWEVLEELRATASGDTEEEGLSNLKAAIRID